MFPPREMLWLNTTLLLHSKMERAWLRTLFLRPSTTEWQLTKELQMLNTTLLACIYSARSVCQSPSRSRSSFFPCLFHSSKIICFSSLNQGVEESLDHAVKWLRKAADEGFELSVTVLERLAAQQNGHHDDEEANNDDDDEEDDTDEEGADVKILRRQSRSMMMLPERHRVKLYSTTVKSNAAARTHELRLIHLLNCKVIFFSFHFFLFIIIFVSLCCCCCVCAPMLSRNQNQKLSSPFSCSTLFFLFFRELNSIWLILICAQRRGLRRWPRSAERRTFLSFTLTTNILEIMTHYRFVAMISFPFLLLKETKTIDQENERKYKKSLPHPNPPFIFFFLRGVMFWWFFAAQTSQEMEDSSKLDVILAAERIVVQKRQQVEEPVFSQRLRDGPLGLSVSQKCFRFAWNDVKTIADPQRNSWLLTRNGEPVYVGAATDFVLTEPDFAKTTIAFALFKIPSDRHGQGIKEDAGSWEKLGEVIWKPSWLFFLKKLTGHIFGLGGFLQKNFFLFSSFFLPDLLPPSLSRFRSSSSFLTTQKHVPIPRFSFAFSLHVSLFLFDSLFSRSLFPLCRTPECFRLNE